MKPKRRRRSFRRRYKGLVAAMAGAAVLSSSLLPGIPATLAHAAVIPNATSGEAATQSEKTTPEAAQPSVTKDKETKPPRENPAASSPLDAARAYAKEHGFDTKRDRFSLQSRGDREAIVLIRTQDGSQYKMSLELGRDNKWTVKSVREVDRDTSPTTNNDPVRVVKEQAANFGFNARSDSFSLLSMENSKAIVQVRSSGQTFKVDLVRRSGRWEITTIRGIGNMTYPATYTPASMFRYQTPLPTPIVIPTEQTTIYKTDDYKDWSWNQTLYPRDMSMGVVMHVSQLVGSAIFIPDHVRDEIRNIDLDRELVLFAYLGSAPSQGYGIAIEKVTQSGNNIYINVAAKSPQANEKTAPSKLDDYVLVNRSKLDFGQPINVIFIDRNSIPLSSFVILPR